MLLALALVGCSAIKLGYSNLGELSYWWLDGYFDFDDDQARHVRQELARLHRWHRQDELPHLVRTLARMEQMAAGDVTAEQVCGVFDELRQRLRGLREQAEPALVATARRLTPANLAQLASKHERNNREWRRKWLRLPPHELTQQRAKQFQEHAERLYGSLEPVQRQVLHEHKARSVFDPARALAERQRRQADLRLTLEQLQAPELDAGQARALLAGLLDRAERSPDAVWERHQEQLVREHCAVSARIHNVASPAQRDAAISRLRSWQRDLIELAGRT
ncbi:DUF6279 family lipoprotein [Ramlibacter aurantiacus]|nr:DUF6279 family lipoprotein [Ramlibacter aurantiacus]